MQVTLPSQWEKLVREKVESGRFGSPTEVVSEGLRLLERSEQEREEKLAALRRDIEVGMRQAEAGDVAPLDIEAIITEAHRRKELAR